MFGIIWKDCYYAPNYRQSENNKLNIQIDTRTLMDYKLRA